ncbi:hypothetical protein [Archaeoglobus sp.]
MSSNNGLTLFRSPLQRVDKNGETKHRKFAEWVARKHGLKNFYDVLEIYEHCYELCMDLCRILGTDLYDLRNELTTLLQRKHWEFIEQLAKDDENVKRELFKTYRLFHKIFVEKKPFSNALVEVFNEVMEFRKKEVDSDGS